MLMTKPTPQLVNQWKETFSQYKDKLCPNKKSATELLEYLKQKYSLRPLKDAHYDNVINANVKSSNYNSYNKNTELKPIALLVENKNSGTILYENQDKIFSGTKIIVGLELTTNFFMVEGSSLLFDELIAFHDLNQEELTNFFLVAQYINCLKKFDLLETVIKSQS